MKPKREKSNLGQRVFFDATSRLTRVFPRAGARFLDFTLRPVVDNPVVSAFFAARNRRIVRRLKSFRRFLIIPDLHIGDAVMNQSALTAVRDFFPEAEVDYVVNKTAYPLIQGNSEATRVLPVFTPGFSSSRQNLKALMELGRTGEYDVCLNFCAHLKAKDVVPPGTGAFDIVSHIASLVHNEKDFSQINHFIYQNYLFTRNLLSLVAPPVRQKPFKGVPVRIGEAAREAAGRFISEEDFSPDRPIIMYNPDAASPYTLLPFRKQAEFLRRIVDSAAFVLLGAGHTEAGIGERLKASLPGVLQSRIKIIPASTSLEVYAALIDASDVFISADTGPLHIAAARKYSRANGDLFRNCTAVLSYFGATPARMSGYDSFQPGYLPSNQDAPSWAFTAGSPCRNITCVNKIFKTCRFIRCFEEADVESWAGRVIDYLAEKPPRSRVVEERAAV